VPRDGGRQQKTDLHGLSCSRRHWLIYKGSLPMKNMARGKGTYISYPCRNILHSNDCRRRQLTVGRNLQRQRKRRGNTDTSSNAIFQVFTAVMLKTHVFWNFRQCWLEYTTHISVDLQPSSSGLNSPRRVLATFRKHNNSSKHSRNSVTLKARRILNHLSSFIRSSACTVQLPLRSVPAPSKLPYWYPLR
jgi:hypothetical protein